MVEDVSQGGAHEVMCGHRVLLVAVVHGPPDTGIIHLLLIVHAEAVMLDHLEQGLPGQAEHPVRLEHQHGIAGGVAKACELYLRLLILYALGEKVTHCVGGNVIKDKLPAQIQQSSQLVLPGCMQSGKHILCVEVHLLVVNIPATQAKGETLQSLVNIKITI